MYTLNDLPHPENAKNGPMLSVHPNQYCPFGKNRRAGLVYYHPLPIAGWGFYKPLFFQPTNGNLRDIYDPSSPSSCIKDAAMYLPCFNIL